MNASAFEIAASGMAAHRTEMDVIAENIANADTSRAPGAAPYRAREAVFAPASSASFADVLGDAVDADAWTTTFARAGFGYDDAETGAPQPVRFAGIIDQSDGSPGSSVGLAADGVDPITQMVGLVAAGRAYDADVAALQAAKQMDVEAIDVDRT